MSSPNEEIERFGLTEVYSPDHPQADVIFVHGLNGDPRRTWTSRKTDVFWPRDLLPDELDKEYQARVLVYGYDADVTASASEGGTSRDRIHNHAELLVAYLVANRRRQRAEDRPIVFVAHSLGGLVVKRALIYSNSVEIASRTERLRSVALSTCGIVFMGTPHHGSDLATWGSYLERLAAILPRKVLDTSSQLVDALKSDSETLINIEREFIQIQDRYNIYYFHEAKKTDIKGTLKFIVDEESAAPAQPNVQRAGIQADHSHMCKFDGENSPGYVLVSGAIVDDIRYEAEKHDVARAWASERNTRQYRLHGATRSPLSLSETPEIVEPVSRIGSPAVMEIESHRSEQRLLEHRPVEREAYFYVPPDFRGNTFFVGMQRQLEILHSRLFDQERRRAGTTSVLLHGTPGAGKSHLARQYIYSHRDNFPGGIFWINARNITEIEKDFWMIAQRIVASDSPNIRVEPSGRGRPFVQAVREWFNSRENWLIVLDGVVVDSKEDVENLQHMIPHNANTSLIYTSRSSQFHVSHRLLHPQLLKVPRLPTEDGMDLLFQETGLIRTGSNETAAREIIKNVGGLPLAIHAISVRLVSTREPLESYRLRSYADDPRLGGPLHEIVTALYYNHRPAYNLMNILAFFAPHVPVELIRMGIKGLRASGLPVKVAVGYSASPDINNSLSILMRNALLERNEPEEIDSAVSSKSSLQDPEPMDLLRLQTVVQKYCRDRLDKGQDQDAGLSEWLGSSVKVLTQSYHSAKQRISDSPADQRPRITDLREYQIHAEQMKEHTIEYERRNQPLATLRVPIEEMLTDLDTQIKKHEPASAQSSVFVNEFPPSIFDRASAASSSSQASEIGPETPNYASQHTADYLWESDHQPIIQSPVSQDKGLTAVEMLRSLSDRTVRPSSAFSDGNPQTMQASHHHRANSQPVFPGTGTVSPSLGYPDLNIHARGEFARPTSSLGNASPDAFDAAPRLAQVYQRSPSASRVDPVSSVDHASMPAYSPMNYAAPFSPPLLRMPSNPIPAPPMLTQTPPNPRATPFYPSSYPNTQPFISHIPYATAYPWGQNQYPDYTNQVFNPIMLRQPALYSPTYAQTSYAPSHMQGQGYESNLQQFGTGFVNVIPAAINSRIQPMLYSGLESSGLVTDPNLRHPRSSSVPNMDAQLPGFAFEDALRRSSAVSSPPGWSTVYTQGSQMVRDTSHRSGSSGSSGGPFSAVSQRTIPIKPIHPLTKVTNPPYSSSSPVQAGQRTSPLQVVQTTEKLSSTSDPSQLSAYGTIAQGSPPVFRPITYNTTSVLDYGTQSAPPNAIFSSSSGVSAPHPASPAPYHHPQGATIPQFYSGGSVSPMPLVQAQEREQAMARTGSGPGIAVATPGLGLGIAEFGGPRSDGLIDGTVKFGEQPAVDIREARRRSILHEEILQEDQRRRSSRHTRTSSVPRGQDLVQNETTRWGAQSEVLPPMSASWGLSQDPIQNAIPSIIGPAPYPDINQMPAETDAARLQFMLEQNEASHRLEQSQLPADPDQAAPQTRRIHRSSEQ